ncbi:MAG TPA: M15 family metallopeptidase [Patescibacteria group bacterium]|nr:M15 family metallopeptidase [Patescibacteria group bacterium]
MRKKIIIIFVIILLAAIGYFVIFKKDKNSNEQQTVENSQQDAAATVDAVEASKYTIDNESSIYYVVNKRRPLPLDYVPSGLTTPNVPLAEEDGTKESMLRGEAASAAEMLFAEAGQKGYSLILASGYRSADLQAYYYNGYVKRDGQAAADKYSAQPGTSEHQTGLAFDISRKDRRCYLEICFGQTPEGKWLAENSYKYGLVIRYPQGKENVTGYQHEPWHFRYVGMDLAEKVYESGKTLEEYFNL